MNRVSSVYTLFTPWTSLSTHPYIYVSIHPVAHSFKKHLLSIHYESYTVQSAELY
jgi:hypothetical protein